MSNPAISTRHATCATREAGRNGSTTSKPNARTDLEHANFQAIALLRRSVSLNIKKQIKDGFDHTPTDVLKMIKKAVAAGTVTDIFIKLQALLDAGPPPSGVDAFEKYQANTIELFNTLSGYNLTFDQVISIRLIHFGKDLYKEYYTQALRQDLDKLPDPIEALQTLQTQAESTPAHKPVAMVASLTATDRSSSTPSAPCRHCGGPHWNRKCPVKDKKSKASSAPSASLAAAPDISTLVNGPVRGYLTAAMSTLAKPSLILDSGATHHIVNDRACFTNFRKCKPAPLEGITGEAVNSIEGVGSAVVRSFDGSIGQLHHALFVPSAPVSLFSASRANAAGYDINLSRGKATVSVDGSICHTGEITNGLYHMHASLVDVTTLIEQPVNMEVALNADLKCDTCQAGKITHHPFPTVASNRSAQPLDRVHMDLLAFDGAVSLGGAKYALVIVDDYTRYLWAIPMSHKSDTFAAFKSWLAKVERSSSRKLLAVRSDNGGEFLSNEFSSFLEEQGITRQLSIPDTPQQNGVAERANRSITEGVRSMLHQSGLSHALWAEALATYVYVKNRSPHSANSGVTPHTRWHGSKPSAGHLRVFGCRAWKAATTKARSKLDPRGIPLVFVGYDLESKGYRLFDPATRQVFKSRSVTFFEDEFPARREGITAAHAPVDDDDDDDDDDEVVVLPDQHANQAPPDQAELPAALRFDAPGPAWQPPVGSRPRNPPARYGALASLRLTPSAFAFSLGKEVTELVADLEAAGIDTSTANRPLSEPEDPFSLPSSDPTTWNEAMRHPHAAAWKAGAIEEFRSMKDDLKVFSVVGLSSVPKGATILPSRHVFRTKRDKAGKMVSLKNRIVAQGCAQGPNSFNNTFSPTAKYTSIRTLIAHSASKGHHIIQADVDKAYLHGVLEEEIYMQVPTGIEGYEGKCLRLHRSIYGLKQAGRVWNDTINATLASLGYRRLACDECIYRHEDAGGDHYIALYVDDLLFFGPDLGEIDRVLDQLDTLYGVKRLGPAEWVLGVQVVRHDDGGISLLQRQYLLDVLARFNMSDCNPCKSPMEANLQLSPEPDTDSADNAIYRSMIGSLMYAGYSDSDWGSDIQTSRSTMGYLFKLAGGAISWSSRLQPRVACSSTEAEYLGLSHAAKEAVFLRSLLTKLGLDTSSPLRLLGDNQGAIALTQNPVFHARTKHLRMLEHFVREHVRNGEISVTYIPTHDMVADIFTKPLPRVVFQRHCDAIGLRRISGQEQGGVLSLSNKKIKKSLHVYKPAALRSRIDPSLAGPSSIFIRLRKVRASDLIPSLSVDNVVHSDPDSMLGAASKYFEGVYEDRAIDDDALEKIIDGFASTRLSHADSNKLEGAHPLEEMTKAQETCKSNSSPGPDGLPVEFYRATWAATGPILRDVINSIPTDDASSRTSARHTAHIHLIHKRGERDRLVNKRPISLINADDRIISQAHNQRLAPLLETLIGSTQRGFVPNRWIGTNIAEVQCLMDPGIPGSEQVSGLLAVMDFEKAYDRLSHTYIDAVLSAVGLVPKTRQWYRATYTNQSASIYLNGWLSAAFDILSGVRQGDLLAPSLFVLAIEGFAVQIRSQVKGIASPGLPTIRELLFADDACCALHDTSDLDHLNRAFELYERTSASKLSDAKSFLYPLGSFRDRPIPSHLGSWRLSDSQFRYLGVQVGVDIAEDAGWEEVKSATVARIRSIPMYDLPYAAKCSIINIYCYTKILYYNRFIPSPKSVVKEIEDAVMIAIHGRASDGSQKPPKVSRLRLCTPLDHGGFGLIDLPRRLAIDHAKWVFHLRDPDGCFIRHLFDIRTRLQVANERTPFTLPKSGPNPHRRSWVWIWQTKALLPPRWIRYFEAWDLVTTLNPPELSKSPNPERWATHVLYFPAGHGIQLSVNPTLFRGPDGEVMTPYSFVNASKRHQAFLYPPILPIGHQRVFCLPEQRWNAWWKALRKVRRVHSDAEDTAHLLSLGSLHPGSQLASPNSPFLHNRSTACVMCLSEAPETLAHLAVGCPFARRLWSALTPFPHPDFVQFVCPVVSRLERRLVELCLLFFHAIWKLSRHRRFSSDPLEPIAETAFEELRASIQESKGRLVSL
ncbi:BQ5605_C011g06268 [Microbotryum silenes-dioicae]|uniref:BQ5605_C011g06268 protein n=1 Tax=Microbotryum silenes-dioicae TaxID=796604 RepID=A0A2X0NRB8_9BASI|nr:BQ5605_C011g06268 [Microbotryum silenes-dioicae]